MRIKEIRVHRYGPLADFALTDPGDFTLVFGPNESGKTLLLDAILRFLLHGKREQALFWNRDRVEHEPNGFVEMQHGDQAFQFPEDGSLPDLLDIQAKDLRNILVVRASDLHVQEGEQKEYYAGLTDRLMGIHREPMRRIIEKLLEIGRLTATERKLSDSEANHKIASRFESARAIIVEIEGLKDEYDIDDLIDLENELIAAEGSREGLMEDLELLQQAEKRERYTSGQQLLDDLESCSANLGELPSISQDDYNAWRDAENETERASKAIDDSDTKLDHLAEDLAQAKVEEQGARNHLGQLEAKETDVQELRDDIRIHRKSLQTDAGRSPLFEAAPRAVLISAVLFAIALLTVTIAPDDSVLRWVAPIAAAAFATSGVLWLVNRVQAGRRRREWEELRLQAAQLGILVRTIEELLDAVQQFSHDFDLGKERLNAAKTERERMERDIASEEQAIDENRKTVKDAQEVLAHLKTEFAVDSLAGLEETRQEVIDLESNRSEIVTKLGERFEEAPGSIEVKMVAWRERVQELAKFAEAAAGVEFDQAEASRLESELKGLESTIGETRGELSEVRERIAAIAQRANEALRPEQGLPGDTLEDLNVVQRELGTFVDETEEQAALSRQSIDILEAIQAEEEQKVKDLFGEDNLASQYLRSITDGAYQSVEYDPESGELQAIRPNEEVLAAYKLSSGTYDQLYLATRLSLAERLLGGEPGFLLLDDPFLTSDENRLDRQLDILLHFAEQGWQITYLTVKDEVPNTLGSAIDEGAVDRIDLPPLLHN